MLASKQLKCHCILSFFEISPVSETGCPSAFVHVWVVHVTAVPSATSHVGSCAGFF